MAADRPKREIAQRVVNESSVALEAIKIGFDRFNAPQGAGSDGLQSTRVMLYYSTSVGPNAVRFQYEGSSVNNQGHAELNALMQFFEKTLEWKSGEFLTYDLELDCTAKPCCLQCSAILGLLGVRASSGTHKSRKRAGIAYAIPPRLIIMLTQLTRYSHGTFEQFHSVKDI